MCYFTLSSLGSLISESPCYVFYVTKYQVYCRLDRDDMAFASTLIWYHTYKKINTPRTGTNRLTQKYILTLTPPAICLPQLYVLHWINHWYQNFILQRWAISLLFKNYSRAEVTYLLTRFNRHSVKVGAGPRDPGTRDPPQSLKVGPGTPLKFKSGTPHFFNEFIFFRIFLRLFLLIYFCVFFK